MLDNLWDSKEKRLTKLREKLQAMTEEDLIAYGKSCRRLAAVRVVSYEPNPWIERLEEARKEWRRRHPPLAYSDSRKAGNPEEYVPVRTWEVTSLIGT